MFAVLSLGKCGINWTEDAGNGELPGRCASCPGKLPGAISMNFVASSCVAVASDDGGWAAEGIGALAFSAIRSGAEFLVALVPRHARHTNSGSAQCSAVFSHGRSWLRLVGVVWLHSRYFVRQLGKSNQTSRWFSGAVAGVQSFSCCVQFFGYS